MKFLYPLKASLMGNQSIRNTTTHWRGHRLLMNGSLTVGNSKATKADAGLSAATLKAASQVPRNIRIFLVRVLSFQKKRKNTKTDFLVSWLQIFIGLIKARIYETNKLQGRLSSSSGPPAASVLWTRFRHGRTLYVIHKFLSWI